MEDEVHILENQIAELQKRIPRLQVELADAEDELEMKKLELSNIYHDLEPDRD